MYIKIEQCDQIVQEARVDTMWLIYETQCVVILALSFIMLIACTFQHENALKRLEKKITYGV